MSSLTIRIPFYRRKTNGGTDGVATFYLKEIPKYSPLINQRVIISHSDVPPSNLKTKLNNLSTNVVSAIFVAPINVLTEPFEGFNVSITLKYDDLTLGTLADGDCYGYIEYDVNPVEYSILKPIENVSVVSESVPFDLNDGYNKLTHIVTGNTYPTEFIKGMFVKRSDRNSIFSNLLKSLNLPVSDEEMKKYTRSKLGKLTVTNGNIFDKIDSNGIKYIWEEHTTTGTTTENLVVHPTSGWTGEYYNTALQTIGSYDYTPTNKAALPVENELYLLFEIPNTAYGEIIDGKTIKLELPYYTGTTSNNIVNERLGFYSYNSTPQPLTAYGTYNKKNLNSFNLDRVLSETDLTLKDIGIKPDLSTTNYESNVVLLFSDNIKKPQGSNLSEWSSGYSDLLDGTRVFNPSSVEKALYDNNLDECIGFVALDKGFIVITHPKIVDSYFRNNFNGSVTISNPTSILDSNKNYNINGTLSTSLTRGNVKTNSSEMIVTLDDSNNVIWDSTQFVLSPTTGTTLYNLTSGVEYFSYNTEKSLNVVCLASSNEFFKSTNDTAKQLLDSQNNDFADFNTSDQNLYPVIITQLGIHDADGNLLAICKPTQPIPKYWYDIVSFNVKIRL